LREIDFRSEKIIAPRRQERQVQNCFPFAAFAPLREKFFLRVLRAFVVNPTFLILVAAWPRRALRGEIERPE
jgi:hypothetical protein